MIQADQSETTKDDKDENDAKEATSQDVEIKSTQDETDQSKTITNEDAQETTTNEGQQDGDDAKVTTSEEQDVKEATPEGMFVSSHRTHSKENHCINPGLSPIFTMSHII